MATDLSRQWLQAERAALARLTGKRKLDKILDSSQPQTLVRSLPSEDLYFTIQEIGLADAAPLVQLASPTQFRAFVDFDVWKEHEVDTEQVLLWLGLARGEDEEEYRRKFHAVDMEVINLLLRGTIDIYDLEEDGEPGDVDGMVQDTVEGRFVLVYPTDGAEYTAARQMIEDLYAEDPFLAGRILYAVRWELKSELTETAYRWRNGRMADLGFPSPEEAASLYAKVPLQGPLPPLAAAPETAPGFYLAGLERESLLDRALALVEGEQRESLQRQLIAVLNSALVADRIDTTDVDAVRTHAKAVRETLALGLEHLSTGDVPRASEILQQAAWKRIFQIGFTRTLELKWRAEQMMKTLPLRLPAGGAFLPDAPDGEILEQMLRSRPRYQGRAFGSLEELAKASAALHQLEARGAGFAKAGLDTAAVAEEIVLAWGEAGLARVRWSDLFVTAAARQALGLPVRFEALPREALAGAARAAFDEEGTLKPSFTEGALSWWKQAAGDDPASTAFAQAALTRLEAELGLQVVSEGYDLDPRFAAPWIVRAD